MRIDCQSGVRWGLHCQKVKPALFLWTNQSDYWRVRTVVQTVSCTSVHWHIPNHYSKAINLVCGASPIDCVLVERKAQHREKWEQQQYKTSLDQLEVKHKCTVKGGLNRNYLQLPFSPLHRHSPLLGPPDWESRYRWAYCLICFTVMSFVITHTVCECDAPECTVLE